MHGSPATVSAGWEGIASLGGAAAGVSRTAAAGRLDAMDPLDRVLWLLAAKLLKEEIYVEALRMVEDEGIEAKRMGDYITGRFGEEEEDMKDAWRLEACTKSGAHRRLVREGLKDLNIGSYFLLHLFKKFVFQHFTHFHIFR
jgi:hypothetical protein